MSDLAGLNENLIAQCTIHKKLLALEEEKTGILVSGDSQALLPLINEQQALVMQSKDLENRRLTMYSDPAFPTLREMIESDSQRKVLLAPVFQELTTVVMTLKKRSARNKRLLESRLSTIRFILGQTGELTGSNTYKKPAKADFGKR